MKIFKLFVAVTFICFALLPAVQAVSPNPDGCYPNFTTAEGCNALVGLTTGEGNTGVGWFALSFAGASNFNTGIGGGALALNTGDSNTAVGAAALLLNNPGHDNTAVGASALVYNFSGAANTALGSEALLFNDQTGHGAASGNTAVGQRALFNNFDASANTAVGSVALANNDSTGNALAIQNTAVGSAALFGNTDGTLNTAVGYQALVSNTLGNGNTASGWKALFSNTGGVANTAVGLEALGGMTTGTANTAIGADALANLTTGSFNIVLGQSGANITTASNVICIGNDAMNVSNTTWINNIYSTTTVSGTTLPVVVSDGGQLGTAPSARRFKKEIKPMDQVSESILALKPVTFHYKSDKTNAPQFGLVAEDVAQINPDLVVRDKSGAIYTVRYDAVNAMLLNEFLKEHQQMQDLKVTVAEQQKQIEALTTGLQKVSAQLELNKPAPRTVLNNR